MSCLLLSSGSRNFLFPSAAIAEIIPYEQPQVLADIPEWLIGILSWRGIPVPLTRIERMASPLAWNTREGFKKENVQKCHIAIVNRVQKTINHSVAYPFFAMIVTGTPKLYRITPESMAVVDPVFEKDPHYLLEGTIQNDRMFIPDLVSLWEMIDALPGRLQWVREYSLETGLQRRI